MATQNLFELLGDEETDASAVIERAEAMEKVKKKRVQQEKTQLSQQQDAPKLPSKPMPPAQAVREFKSGQQEGGRGRGARGRGNANRDREVNFDFRNRNRDFDGGPNPPSEEGGFLRNRNFTSNEGYRQDSDSFQTNRGRFYGQGRPVQTFGEDEDSGHTFEVGRGGGRFRGGARRQGRVFGEVQQQRAYVRRDTAGGHENTEHKPREIVNEKEVEPEPQIVLDKAPDEKLPKVEEVADLKENEEEDKEMSLDEYYKVLDEKNRHLKSQRSEERKVVLDKDLAKMTKVERKENTADFMKPGPEKDKGKKKETVPSTDEKIKKNMSINEFLRPAEGEYFSSNRRDRRGRGRGTNERGEGYRGSFGFNYSNARQDSIPHIEDQSQFPTLGAA